MNDDAESPIGNLSTDALIRIDQACLEFESAWKRGESPRIEQYLDRWQAMERSCLLCELLLLDLYYR